MMAKATKAVGGTLALVLVTVVVLFALASVVALTFAGKSVADVVYLLAAILPGTLAAMLGVKKQTENSNKLDVAAAKLDTVVEQTNGPITAANEKLDALHDKVTSG